MNVNLTVDGIDEPDEFFNYNLTRNPNLHHRIKLSPAVGRVDIIDENCKCDSIFYIVYV